MYLTMTNKLLTTIFSLTVSTITSQFNTEKYSAHKHTGLKFFQLNKVYCFCLKFTLFKKPSFIPYWYVLLYCMYKNCMFITGFLVQKTFLLWNLGYLRMLNMDSFRYINWNDNGFVL